MANAPTHHLIIALDIESFSSRTEPVQASLRAALYQAAAEATELSGLKWSECVTLDRGDGMYVLVPPKVSPVTLLDPFVHHLTSVLRRHAMQHSAAAAMRLRVALHAGYLSADDTGWVGAAINVTSRLIDSEQLHATLAAARGAHLALAISDDLHKAVVLAGHGGLGPEAFRRVAIESHGVRHIAWIHSPGATAAPDPGSLPPDDEPPSTAAPPEEHAPNDPPARRYPGQIFNDTVTVTRGDIVGRDVIYGSGERHHD